MESFILDLSCDMLPLEVSIMEKLPAIYENRAKLLRLSLDIKMSAAEFNELVTPMEGKSEEEKEEIAKQLLQELQSKR